MPLDNTAKLSDIITALQTMEGINAKAELASVVGNPAKSTDSMTTLVSLIQGSKNKAATNLTTKGVSASGTETLDSLATKIASMSVKKWASGSGNTIYENGYKLTVGGLNFTPSIIIYRFGTAGSSTGQGVYAANSALPIIGTSGQATFLNSIGIVTHGVPGSETIESYRDSPTTVTGNSFTILTNPSAPKIWWIAFE